MNKKIKSTSDEFIESLNPKELKKFNEKYKEFALSELVLAIIEQDEDSVQKLAKIACVSPNVIRTMSASVVKKDFSMHSFFKILKGLGCKKFMVEFNGQFIPLNITHTTKK